MGYLAMSDVRPLHAGYWGRVNVFGRCGYESVEEPGRICRRFKGHDGDHTECGCPSEQDRIDERIQRYVAMPT